MWVCVCLLGDEVGGGGPCLATSGFGYLHTFAAAVRRPVCADGQRRTYFGPLVLLFVCFSRVLVASLARRVQDTFRPVLRLHISTLFIFPLSAPADQTREAEPALSASAVPLLVHR